MLISDCVSTMFNAFIEASFFFRGGNRIFRPTTFEGYFEDQTRIILYGIAKHLEDKADLMFIYAEMSFFELWWSRQTAE
ncbi:hypothetical protein GPALN_010739 [Globodera pallida]|nr:hypothetical protein GPALN_010739 [Globodera pallida]